MPSRLAWLPACALGLLLAGCPGGRGQLAVDLRTDLRAGVEITRVVTELHRGPTLGAVRHQAESALGMSDDALGGVRVAELDGIEPGTWLVRVRLFDATGAHAGTGLVLVPLDEAPRVVTVRVTRDCRDVTCPGDGAPGAIACLGGRCVEPACPEDPSKCPPPECAADGDCAASGPACVRGVCLDGVCAEYPDDARCGGALCDRADGCARVESDAGVADAGIPCVQVPNISLNISYPMLGAGSPTWNAPGALACPSAPSGQSPYYYEVVYCNEQPAPYGIELRIANHPSFPTVSDPTIWGYRGAGVPPDPNDCDFVVSGVGNRTPYVLLSTGEYYTIRVGPQATGEEGSLAAVSSP